MNEREREVLCKLAEYKLCSNEIKAVLHMLGGGDFATVPVTPASRERLITMLKRKNIIEKVGKRYVFRSEFAGVFSAAPRAQPAAPAEKAPEPAPPPAPAPVPVAPAPKTAPAVQAAQEAAPTATQAAVAVESRPALARFPAFTPRAQAFLARQSGQQADTLREWFRRGLGEKAGQVALDAVSDLAAGVEPKHNAHLDRTLADLEALAARLFTK